MRHHRKTLKLGRTTAHRDAMLANQVCSLIEHRRIKTTLAKAKAARSLAEKMVTLGKKGTLHARRIAISYLRDKESVKKLFTEIAPAAAERQGGYTRIIKLGPRQSDSAPMALLEWVDEPTLLSEALAETPAMEELKKEPKKTAKKEKTDVGAEESQEAPARETTADSSDTIEEKE